jgi:hypothetical protein
MREGEYDYDEKTLSLENRAFILNQILQKLKL